MGSSSVLASSLYFPSEEARLGRLESNSVLGDFIVASRDVAAGELMCEGTPLMVCPCTGVSDLGFICLTCFKPCNAECTVCGWPICCSICQKVHKYIFCHTNIVHRILYDTRMTSQFKIQTAVPTFIAIELKFYILSTYTDIHVLSSPKTERSSSSTSKAYYVKYRFLYLQLLLF